ncbi:MAG: hypothetical protein COT84_07615, partial [Chlamydiae bacterium CG10_big_fil_rev_8_21_14_0_10_35_9]
MSLAISALRGFSNGHQFAMSKTKEDEVRQGGNHFLASLPQITQIAAVSNVLYDNAIAPHIKTACKVVTYLSIPLCPLLGVIKGGTYKTFATTINNFRFELPEKLGNKTFPILPFKLPENLGNKTVTVLSYISAHLGDIAVIAIAIESIALVVIGNYAYGISMLAVIGYEVLDNQLGIIPRKVSLFMEEYFPVISCVGLIISNTILFRALGVVSFLQKNVSFQCFLQKKVDLVARQFTEISTPSLQELDGPLYQNKNLTFDQINRILGSEDSEYELNPAHFSKNISLDSLPKNHNFNAYLTLFDSIEWSQKFNLLKAKVKDDDLFINSLLEDLDVQKDLIEKNIPKGEEAKTILKENIEYYVEMMANSNGLSKERYLESWARRQMEKLVSTLSGDARFKGSQRDASDAINYCAKILCYLLSTNKAENQIEFEDALLSLAVECGDYCARGVKRRSRQLLDGILVRDNLNLRDPIKKHELRVLQQLQNLRLNIMEQAYQSIIEVLKLHSSISEDVHSFDTYRSYLALGFLPMTHYERKRIGVSDVLMWESYFTIRESMTNDYLKGINDAIAELGNIHSSDYIRRIINGQKNLTTHQKDQILELYYGQWSPDETNHRFNRLMLVILGVLQQK